MTVLGVDEVLDRQLREACPPSWGQQEWDGFVFLLREWWSEPAANWTNRRIMGLAIGVADFSPELARGALRRLRDGGQKFPPRVPEIANAIHTDTGTPSWTEAFALLFDPPDGVVHARMPRDRGVYDSESARESARWPRLEQAMIERAGAQHEMLAAFVAAFGAKRLAALPLECPQYGRLETERLRQRWVEFTERADARRRQGLPLLTAPLARRELGPRRLQPLLQPLAQLGLATDPEARS